MIKACKSLVVKFSLHGEKRRNSENRLCQQQELALLCLCYNVSTRTIPIQKGLPSKMQTAVLKIPAKVCNMHEVLIALFNFQKLYRQCWQGNYTLEPRLLWMVSQVSQPLLTKLQQDSFWLNKSYHVPDFRSTPRRDMGGPNKVNLCKTS